MLDIFPSQITPEEVATFLRSPEAQLVNLSQDIQRRVYAQIVQERVLAQGRHFVQQAEVNVDDLIDTWLARLRQSPKQTTYRAALRFLALVLDQRQKTVFSCVTTDANIVVATLQEQFPYHTQVAYLTAFVQFFDFLKQASQVSTNPFQGFELTIHYETLTTQWLATHQSKATRTTYTHALSIFQEYLNIRRVDWLDLSPEDAEAFVQYLQSRFRNTNTVRLTYAAVSSFYAYLVQHAYLAQSPFLRGKLPKVKFYTTSLRVPTQDDLDRMVRYLREEQSLSSGSGYRQRVHRAQWLELIIDVLSTYGFRVGALHPMSVDSDTGRFVTISKETEIQGFLEQRFLQQMRTLEFSFPYPFKPYNEKRIEKAFQRLMQALWQDASYFSPHDLRRHAAIREYEQSGFDLEHVRQFLYQADIETTKRYIQGMYQRKG